MSKWISTKERLPATETGTVLCVVYGKPKENISLVGDFLFGEYCSSEGVWRFEEYPDWLKGIVSHWMPLPEPPKVFVLKACPFCGGRAKSVNDLDAHLIVCEACGAASGYYDILKKAVDAWNSRSTDENRSLRK